MRINRLAPNSQGEMVPSPEPLLCVVAVAARGHIHLSSDGWGTYRVVYGLQSKDFQGLQAGLAELAACVEHCNECEDLIDV